MSQRLLKETNGSTLVVQQLRIGAPNAGGLGLIPVRSRMQQLRNKWDNMCESAYKSDWHRKNALERPLFPKRMGGRTRSYSPSCFLSLLERGKLAFKSKSYLILYLAALSPRSLSLNLS